MIAFCVFYPKPKQRSSRPEESSNWRDFHRMIFGILDVQLSSESLWQPSFPCVCGGGAGGAELGRSVVSDSMSQWLRSGSSVHGILQAGILEWAAISFSSGSSWPRDRSIAGFFTFLYIWATRETHPQYVETWSFPRDNGEQKSQTTLLPRQRPQESLVPALLWCRWKELRMTPLQQGLKSNACATWE